MRPKNSCKLCWEDCNGKSQTNLYLLLEQMAERLTQWPRKFNSRTPNIHFVGLKTMPKSCKQGKRRHRCSWCSSLVIRISPIYTYQKCNPRSTCSIKRQKVCVALRRPNGTRRNLNRTKGMATTAVLGMSSGSTGIWWYARMRSTMVQQYSPRSLAVKSWMCGTG